MAWEEGEFTRPLYDAPPRVGGLVGQIAKRLAHASGGDRAYERPMTWPEADQLVAEFLAQAAALKLYHEAYSARRAAPEGSWDAAYAARQLEEAYEAFETLSQSSQTGDQS